MELSDLILGLAVILSTCGLARSHCISDPVCYNGQPCKFNRFGCSGLDFAIAGELKSEQFPSNRYDSLISLKLNDSGIKFLGETVFYNMHGLKVLSLSFNSISNISCCVFSSLPILDTLDLSYNKIRFIDEKGFSNLFALRVLQLNHNQLTSLGEGKLFSDLENLSVLNLSNNKLFVLPDNIFSSLHKITTLHLSFNELIRIPVDRVSHLMNLTTLTLNANTLECNCDLRQLLLWCDSRGLSLRMVCRKPPSFEKIDWNVLRSFDNCSNAVFSASSGMSYEMIIIIVLVVLFSSVIVYFGVRILKKRRGNEGSLAFGEKNIKQNAIPSVNNEYSYATRGSWILNDRKSRDFENTKNTKRTSHLYEEIVCYQQPVDSIKPTNLNNEMQNQKINNRNVTEIVKILEKNKPNGGRDSIDSSVLYSTVVKHPPDSSRDSKENHYNETEVKEQYIMIGNTLYTEND